MERGHIVSLSLFFTLLSASKFSSPDLEVLDVAMPHLGSRTRLALETFKTGTFPLSMRKTRPIQWL